MNIISILQTAISPVILISGIGLLLLTMTNRLSRTIDRARDLQSEKETLGADEGGLLKSQLNILWRRARLIRTAIILASAAALCAAFLIAVLFVTMLVQWNAAWLVAGLFMVCLLLLVAALIFFIQDVNESLGALKLELKQGK